MSKIATSTLLVAFLVSALFFRCQVIPPEASKVAYVSANQSTTSQRLSSECAFRYTIANYYSQLDDASQREAIQTGFNLWQKACTNIGFLELKSNPILQIQFVNPADLPAPIGIEPIGIVQGTPTIIGGLRKEANGTYSILLSNAYQWDKTLLTKAIAYHAGLFMGMTTSSESGNVMTRLSATQGLNISKSDSLALNKSFATSCRDLSGVSFLPLNLKVNSPLTKTIRVDKQGRIYVKASGYIRVGNFVGTSGPEGKLNGGVLGLPIDGYSIEKQMPHAVLMYKLNDETAWRQCGQACSFLTTGDQYINITFTINDLDLTDNSGAYDVVVDYQ